MRKDFLGLIAVVAAFVVGGTILMQSKILPEERAQDFRTLENISLQSQIQVIQEPTASDNTYIYAINKVARESWEIAKQDARVQAILDGSNGKALTIAAVQPSAFVSPDGKVTHSGLGQVIITANWQAVDGKQYASAKSFSSLDGRQGQSRQQIWNVAVDIDRDKVISIQGEQERVMTETLRANVVYGGMNIYMPDAAVAKAGSSVRWVNESNVPHNVVGTYKTEAGEEKIDSGFFRANEDWEHTFSEKGTFDYHCTIHSEEGMKGRLVIS
ncbi:MAG: cupredoxin domain-containing protein [Nitrososphaera sp.]|uniref:cupredoxin domain-containing protein n=1 Tax=Nitrososphaera sp. TaxID=1971748 RepID=UPI003D6E49C1